MLVKSHTFWLSQVSAMSLMETLEAICMEVIQKMWALLMYEAFKLVWLLDLFDVSRRLKEEEY